MAYANFSTSNKLNFKSLSSNSSIIQFNIASIYAYTFNAYLFLTLRCHLMATTQQKPGKGRTESSTERRPENRFLRQIIKPLGLVKEKKMKERGIWVVQQCNGTSEKRGTILVIHSLHNCIPVVYYTVMISSFLKNISVVCILCSICM